MTNTIKIALKAKIYKSDKVGGFSEPGVYSGVEKKWDDNMNEIMKLKKYLISIFVI